MAANAGPSRAGRPGAVQEQLTKGLKKLKKLFDRAGPEFLKGVQRTSPVPIAECSGGDGSLVLVWVPVNLKAVLSKREIQVVLGVAEGHANKTIASALDLSESTVAAHLRRIYTKLAVTSRPQLARLAIGLVGEKYPGAVLPC